MSVAEAERQVQQLRFQADKAWRDYYALSRRASEAFNFYYNLAQKLRQLEATRRAEQS